MNTQEEILFWTNTTVDKWRNQGIALGVGATDAESKYVERLVQFQFPPDFKALYKIANGFENSDWNEHMFCIWPLDRIVIEKEFEKESNFIGFTDFLICSHFVGFVKSKSGIYKSYDSDKHTEKISETFQEAIDLINNSDDKIY